MKSPKTTGFRIVCHTDGLFYWTGTKPYDGLDSPEGFATEDEAIIDAVATCDLYETCYVVKLSGEVYDDLAPDASDLTL